MHYSNTNIYTKSLELNRLSKHIVHELPRGMAFIADQLRRAASSITLNFAEGCGKNSIKEKQRFYTIAKASAYEVAAILDVAHEWQAISESNFYAGHDMADHLAAMLTKLALKI